MARKKDDPTTSFEEQLRQLDEMNARAAVNQLNRNERNFSTMLDRQQEMLTNFYRASTEAGRESIKADMEDRQQRMKEQLDAMKRSYSLYSQFMTKTERQTFQNLYQTTKDGMDKIDKEMQKRFGDLEDDFDDLAESFSDKIDRISDELRDLGTALNIDAIAQSLEESVDSYIENLRQTRTRTGDTFDEKAYEETIDSLNKAIGSLNRASASESVSNMIRDFGMKNMSEISYYARTMASADVLGLSKDDLGNIMWKDLAQGKQGKMMRNITNMAIALEDNEDLYVHADSILNVISGNIDAIYGLTYKNDKKQTKMVTSLAALEALSESEANSGVTSMTEMFQEWSKLTLPELMEDDKALSFANMMGVSLTELQDSLIDPDKLGGLIESFQSRLSTMNDYQLNMWKEQMGFDYVYQLKEIVADSSLVSSYNTAVDQIGNSIANSLENGESSLSAGTSSDLLLDAANEAVGDFKAWTNGMTSNSMVSAITDAIGELDLSIADIGGMITIVSTLMKGGGALTKLLGKLPGGAGKFFQGLGGLGKGAAEATGSASTAGGVISKTASIIAPYAAGVAPGAALAGYGLYGVTQGFDAAKSAGTEWNEGNYGRSTAYGADTAALVGAGATTAVAGGMGIAAGISAAAGGATAGAAAIAGLSAIPVVGWVAAGVLALGLGTKAILDNTKKVNGFAKGIESMEDGMKASVDNVIESQQRQLVSIKNTLATSNGAVTDIENAKNQLIENGISPEILARMNSAGELENFTQKLIDACNSAEQFANMGVEESINEAVDELKYQFNDDKRQDFIDTAASKLLGVDGSAKEDTAEWDTTKRFFDALAGTMEEGQAKDDFVKAYTTALTSHGGISEAELKALLGDKSFSSGWRAFWSSDIDLKKSYFDNATDYSGYNAIVDTFLGGDDSLRIDTSKIDAITGNTELTSLMYSDYETWKNYKDKDANVADQYKYQYENSLKELQKVSGYEEYFKDRFEGYAHEMGIEGYLKGLSNVPNDGLAYLHQGEAVLTAQQADVVRAKADGGIDVSSGAGLMSGVIIPLLKRMGFESMAEFGEDTNTSVINIEKLLKEFFSYTKGTVANLSGGLEDSGLLGTSSGGSGIFTRILRALTGSSRSSSGSAVGSYGGSGVTGGTGTGVPASTVSASDAKGKIWNFFANKGVSAAGIAGIMGNMQMESGFNSANLQNSYEKSLGMTDASYTQAVDNGTYSNFVNDSAGYGLVQFTYYTLKRDLLNKARSKGTSISDIDTQLEVLWDQVSGTSWFNKLKTTNSVSTAADLFLENYERPAVYNYDARRGAANSIYSEFAGNSYAVGTPWLENTQVALVHEGEMIVPADVNPLNSTTSTIPITPSESDNSDVVDALRWAVSRLEAKLDKVIANTANSGTRRRAYESTDIDKAYSL